MPTYPTVLTIVNPGAELNATTGWTMQSGSLPQVRASGADVPAHTGSFYFCGSASSAASSWYQDIDVSAFATDIDAGLYAVDGRVYMQGFSGDADNGALLIECLDVSNVVLLSNGTGQQDPTSWVQQIVQYFIPPLTRTIRIRTNNVRVAGTQLSIYYDDFTLSLIDPTTLPAVEGRFDKVNLEVLFVPPLPDIQGRFDKVNLEVLFVPPLAAVEGRFDKVNLEVLFVPPVGAGGTDNNISIIW